ncbi:acyl-CoA carboxylase subunit epsilon [Actinospica robiniae]|uniref:acyl-CoA carboxylase subunit epsilon n=1 Tax=Actinospica robiniae TaxID=304901 RepID=UPI0003FF93D9|nr:acyl-CoA carboxylase subunit epsilon [Actinospica robiniae]
MIIKVLRGNPTDEELAAALVVLHTRAVSASVSPVAPEAAESLDAWADRQRAMARFSTARPGPGAWRATYWPR